MACAGTFLIVLIIASNCNRRTVRALLATVVVGIAVHTTLAVEVPMAKKVVSAKTKDDKVKKLLLDAFEKLNAKDFDGTFELIKSIQKLDPLNADAQFLGGKVAEHLGTDPTPIMMQGACWGSGFAFAWLQEKGKDGGPCCRVNGGGTDQAGNTLVASAP